MRRVVVLLVALLALAVAASPSFASVPATLTRKAALRAVRVSSKPPDGIGYATSRCRRRSASTFGCTVFYHGISGPVVGSRGNLTDRRVRVYRAGQEVRVVSWIFGTYTMRLY